MAATYKYDPYGRTLSSSDTLASANVYRFSSKETHPNSGFYYYGYRFYDPNTQRWLNRNPIMERGGVNLYVHVGNNPCDRRDPFGLYEERQNCRGSTDIIVGKCEIVILYGHGSADNPHRFVFDGPSSFGHFVGCGSAATNDRIKPQRRVPGAPSARGDLLSGPSASSDPDGGLSKHLDGAIAAARKLAGELCKAGKCKKMTIYTVAAGRDSVYNLAGSNSHLPRETTEVVECCAKK
jgi:RHS repeat-associated protein